MMEQGNGPFVFFRYFHLFYSNVYHSYEAIKLCQKIWVILQVARDKILRKGRFSQGDIRNRVQAEVVNNPTRGSVSKLHQR